MVRTIHSRRSSSPFRPHADGRTERDSEFRQTHDEVHVSDSKRARCGLLFAMLSHTFTCFTQSSSVQERGWLTMPSRFNRGRQKYGDSDHESRTAHIAMLSCMLHRKSSFRSLSYTTRPFQTKQSYHTATMTALIDSAILHTFTEFCCAIGVT